MRRLRLRHYAEALALTIAATTFAHGLGRLLALRDVRTTPALGGLDDHIERASAYPSAMPPTPRRL